MRDVSELLFVIGRTYVYPINDGYTGVNCLNDCGSASGNLAGKRDFSDYLIRGHAHAAVVNKKAGVNGLFDMGSNVWEWPGLEWEQSVMGAISGHHGQIVMGLRSTNESES